MKLSAHFTLEELTHSDTAVANHIANEPTPEHLENIIHWLVPGLEQIREILGNEPVDIHDAYRNPQVNHLVGGTATSAHPLGLASDLSRKGQTPLQSARLIAAAMKAGKIKIDQMILERTPPSTVHVSFDPRGAKPGQPSRARGMMGRQPGGPGTPIDWSFFK